MCSEALHCTLFLKLHNSVKMLTVSKHIYTSSKFISDIVTGEQALFLCDFYLPFSKIKFIIMFSYKLWCLKVTGSFSTSLDLFKFKELPHLLQSGVWNWLKYSRNRNQYVTLNCEENGPKSVEIVMQEFRRYLCRLQLKKSSCSKVFQGCFKIHWYLWCIYALLYLNLCLLVQ